MTTQLAETAGLTPYRSQNAAVSASAGSISATPTASAGRVPSRAASAAATGGASRSARVSAGATSSSPMLVSTASSCHQPPRHRPGAGSRHPGAASVKQLLLGGAAAAPSDQDPEA